MKCAFIEEYGSGFRVKKMCRARCVFQEADITHGKGVPKVFGSKKMNA
jgi:hypothetical protein